jgi:hypothetical protein
MLIFFGFHVCDDRLGIVAFEYTNTAVLSMKFQFTRKDGDGSICAGRTTTPDYSAIYSSRELSNLIFSNDRHCPVAVFESIE